MSRTTRPTWQSLQAASDATLLAARPAATAQRALVRTGCLRHHHVVWAAQVVAQGTGTSVGPFPVGAGQQIVDKIAAQVELDLGDGSAGGNSSNAITTLP